MLTTKILLLVCVSSMAGCVSKELCNDSHSCPEPGHGPCYLCDTPERDGSSNYELSEVQ